MGRLNFARLSSFHTFKENPQYIKKIPIWYFSGKSPSLWWQISSTVYFNILGKKYKSWSMLVIDEDREGRLPLVVTGSTRSTHNSTVKQLSGETGISVGLVELFLYTISTWIGFLRSGYLAIWPVTKRSRSDVWVTQNSPSNGVQWHNYISLKTW